MYYIVLFVSLLFLINVYFRVADYFNIIDKPNFRSSHSVVTIRGGGIIFTIGAIGWFLSSGFQLPFFVLGLVVISVVSFVDDVKSVSRRVRFGVQMGAVILMFYQLYYNYFIFYNHFIPSGFFGIDLFHFPSYNNVTPSGFFGMILIVIVAIGIINAYNFMDGINGITGGYSLAVLAGLWMANNDVIGFVDNRLIYSIAIALMVFNIYNFRVKARCFAGDVGSVSIAFILIFLIGKLILVTGNWVYLFFLALYGVDSVMTIVHRIYLRENIFEAHRKHFYQVLANEGGVSQLKVSMGYTLVQVFINIMIVALVGSLSMVWMGLVIFGLLVGLTGVYIWGKRRFLH